MALPHPPPRSEIGDKLLTLLRSTPGTSICEPCLVALLQFMAGEMLKACRELILHGLVRGDYADCSICRKPGLVVRLRTKPFSH